MPRNTGDRLLRAFWSKVDTSGGLEACWPWAGQRTVAGYGQIKRDARPFYAHRLSLEIALGRPLGEGMSACHTCDNPPCVNPAHLFEGSHVDNMADMVQKGRQGHVRHPESVARGSAVHSSKLTTSQADEIRRRYSGRHGEQAQLADEFGVSRSTIHLLLSGRRYAA